MGFASLTVTSPKNRIVYLNGNYDDPAGNSSFDTFTVPSGGNIAEVLNVKLEVIFRKKFRVEATETAVSVALDPVSPSEPTQ